VTAICTSAIGNYVNPNRCERDIITEPSYSLDYKGEALVSASPLSSPLKHAMAAP
jgi:hypothetical protein